MRSWVLLFSLVALSRPASAELKFAFADLSLNHLDWSAGTEDKSSKRDFAYLELEGYAEYDWGDIYGFFDYENPGKRGVDVRTAGKGAIYRKLGLAGLAVYASVYNFSGHGFSEQNRVLGLGYIVSSPTFWFKPFVGLHEVTQTFYSGPNGFMAGWTVGYNFSIGSEKFMLADWHEFEFERNPSYAQGQGGERSGHNGAVSIWWHALEKLSTGVQWRYTEDKLGTAGSSRAVIYTVKYFL